jgi:NTP pyrophosphatase (non-canonical NTP hydrolase)
MERFIDLQTKVLNWADDRGIIDNGTCIGQACKTLEEATELLTNVTLFEAGVIHHDSKDIEEEIKDAIGDTLVTLIIQAEMQGFCILDALESAYEVINQRKGRMINGQFVKETE